MSLESLKAKLLADPEVKKHYDELAPEFDEAKRIIMENRAMKKLTIEYQGYKLEVEIQDKYLTSDTDNTCPYIKGTCDKLHSFVKSGYYENILPILDEFMKWADKVVKNQ